MGLVLDCPERLLYIRVRDTLMTKPSEWEGITITRETQGQYRITGHGVSQKVGSGTMRLETVLALVVKEVLALHQTQPVLVNEAASVTEPLPVPDKSPALAIQIAPEVLTMDSIERTLFAELGRLPEQTTMSVESPAPSKPVRQRRNTIHPKQLPLWSSA